MVWVFHYITEGLQKHITLVNETERTQQREIFIFLSSAKQENQGYATLIDFINQERQENEKL